MVEKFNKTELLERYSKVIDKANELLDKEDVQRVQRLTKEAKPHKAENQVWFSEIMRLEKKYCEFGDRISSTALTMAITGNTLF